jgi:hypothetical protein
MEQIKQFQPGFTFVGERAERLTSKTERFIVTSDKRTQIHAHS